MSNQSFLNRLGFGLARVKKVRPTRRLPAGTLGGIHRLVGGCTQRIGFDTVVRINRDPDAGAGANQVSFQLKRDAERQLQCRGQHLGPFRSGDLANHGELVATAARQRVGATHTGSEPQHGML